MQLKVISGLSSWTPHGARRCGVTDMAGEEKKKESSLTHSLRRHLQLATRGETSNW